MPRLLTLSQSIAADYSIFMAGANDLFDLVPLECGDSQTKTVSSLPTVSRGPSSNLTLDKIPVLSYLYKLG